MESQPQNLEFRINPENFHHVYIGLDKQIVQRNIVKYFLTYNFSMFLVLKRAVSFR